MIAGWAGMCLALPLLIGGFADDLPFDPEAITEPLAGKPYIRTDESGRCYLKAVRRKRGVERNETLLFRVGVRKDSLLARFPWVHGDFSVHCGSNLTGDLDSPYVAAYDYAVPKAGADSAIMLRIYRGARLIKAYRNSEFATPRVSTDGNNLLIQGALFEAIGFEASGPRPVFKFRLVGGDTLSIQAHSGKFLSRKPRYPGPVALPPAPR